MTVIGKSKAVEYFVVRKHEKRFGWCTSGCRFYVFLKGHGGSLLCVVSELYNSILQVNRFFEGFLEIFNKTR